MWWTMLYRYTVSLRLLHVWTSLFGYILQASVSMWWTMLYTVMFFSTGRKIINVRCIGQEGYSIILYRGICLSSKCLRCNLSTKNKNVGYQFVVFYIRKWRAICNICLSYENLNVKLMLRARYLVFNTFLKTHRTVDANVQCGDIEE